MNAVFRTLLTAAAILAAPTSAFATWSIIAVDQDTGRVSMGTASCVDNPTDREFRTFTSVIVPGVGVAACQAAVDRSYNVQKFIYDEIKKGTDPKAILEKLAHDDPDYQRRQLAIVDLKGRMAAHTGLDNSYVAQDVQGQVPGTHIFFSVQANTMRAGKVVPNAAQAFLKTKGALSDRVMAAMDAADGSGGDARCTCPPYPTDGSTPPIPCSNRAAHAGWVIMATPDNKNVATQNDGDYALFLTVIQPGEGRGPNQIHVGEDLNPAKTLRMRYDAWRKQQPPDYK
jgi:hypothetical protein